MPDCPTNLTDCLPAGSNAVDPCSACFEPTTENFQQALAELSRMVCAQGNQVKSWNQRLDKFRNRMTRIENEIANLPTSESADILNPCSNMATLPEEGAESILACGAGTQVGLLPDLEGCSEIVGSDGKWLVKPRGLTWHPLSPLQTLTTVWASQTFTALNGYDDIVDNGCEIWGVCDYQTFLTANTSVTSGTSIASVNGILTSAQYFTSGNDVSDAGVVMFPMTSKSITLAVANSYVGSITFSSALFRLLGYFA